MRKTGLHLTLEDRYIDLTFLKTGEYGSQEVKCYTILRPITNPMMSSWIKRARLNSFRETYLPNSQSAQVL